MLLRGTSRPARLTDLKFFADAEIGRLRREDIETVGDLWKRVGSESDRRVEQFCQKTRLPIERIRELRAVEPEWRAAVGDGIWARITLGSVRLFTAFETEALSHQGVQTADDLWRSVGRDPDRGVDRLAQATGLQRSRLIGVLSSLAEREAALPALWPRPFASAWLLLGMVVLVVLLSLGNRLWLAPLLTRQTVVVARSRLPPFHLIGPADVVERKVPGHDGAVFSRQDVVGRYTLVAIPSDSIVLANQVSSRCGSPAGDNGGDRPVLVLRVLADPGTVKPGSCLSFLIVPRGATVQDAAPRVLDQVTVLSGDASSRPPTLAVAVRMAPAELAALRPVLDTSDLFVTHP